eukprot:11496161-Ditylum_brightwellii.AAC.1
MNAAFNSGIKLHVRGKGEFRCFRSQIYVPDKQLVSDGGKKHHGNKHAKKPDEIYPAFQSDLGNTTFHNDQSNNKFNGCNVHNDHIKADKGDIHEKSNAIGEPTVHLVKDGDASNLCDSNISSMSKIQRDEIIHPNQVPYLKRKHM